MTTRMKEERNLRNLVKQKKKDLSFEKDKSMNFNIQGMEIDQFSEKVT